MNKDDEKDYEPMPQTLLDLIETERQEDIRVCHMRLARLKEMSPLEYVSHCGVSLLSVPRWVSQLAGETAVGGIRLLAYPSKSPGAWRLETRDYERYIHHKDVLAAFKEG